MTIIKGMYLTLVAVLLLPMVASATDILYGLDNTNLTAAGGHSILYTVDTTTGAATAVGDTGFNLRGLAYNSLTGRAYGSLAARESGGGFYEINLSTGAATLIGGTENFSNMDFDASGNLFGYNSRTSSSVYDFFSIDVSTGVGTVLNANALNTGIHALFGIAYSSADDEMYFYQQWNGGFGSLADIRLV